MHESTHQVNPRSTAQAITPKQFTYAIVESVVARHPGVTVEDVFGRGRTRAVVVARFEAIAEIVEARPHWSYPTIGRLFNRDHSTIMSALAKVGALRPRERKREYALEAVRSVSDFIQEYEAVADCREYLAVESVASFVRNFLLPAWARPEGGAQ